MNYRIRRIAEPIRSKSEAEKPLFELSHWSIVGFRRLPPTGPLSGWFAAMAPDGVCCRSRDFYKTGKLLYVSVDSFSA